MVNFRRRKFKYRRLWLCYNNYVYESSTAHICRYRKIVCVSMFAVNTHVRFLWYDLCLAGTFRYKRRVVWVSVIVFVFSWSWKFAVRADSIPTASWLHAFSYIMYYNRLVMTIVVSYCCLTPSTLMRRVLYEVSYTLLFPIVSSFHTSPVWVAAGVSDASVVSHCFLAPFILLHDVAAGVNDNIFFLSSPALINPHLSFVHRKYNELIHT